MKRSGTVGLVLMGGAAFAATFAGGMAYLAWQKPSHAATTPGQPQAAQAQQAQQTCTTRPDGTQNCQPVRRSFVYFLYPSYYGWGGSSSTRSPEPRRMQNVALTGNPQSHAPSAGTGASGTSRGGFGSSGGSFRVSAGS